MDYVLESRVWIGRPRPDVFAFFADPRNLSRVMPRGAGVTLVSRGERLAVGAVVDYRVRWLGIPLRWRAFIREFDPPYRFVDVQVRGPWARFEHRHLFLEEDGGTVMEDRVTYRPPLGALGTLGHALLLRRQLARAWRVRGERLAEHLGPVRTSGTLRPRAG